jgi:hypothetical protein
MEWKYTSATVKPGESHYDVLREYGSAGWEAWHIEGPNFQNWREIFFKRPAYAE